MNEKRLKTECGFAIIYHVYLGLNAEGYPSIMVCDHTMIINLFSASLSQGRAPDLWDRRSHKNLQNLRAGSFKINSP